MSLIAYRPVAAVVANGADGKPIASVRFSPTPATEARLAGHRLSFRPYPGGFRLSAQHDLDGSGGPLVPFGSEPLPLVFAITSSDSGFRRRHLRSVSSAAGPNIFLTNRSATGTPQSGPALSRDAKVGEKDMGRIAQRRLRVPIPIESGPRPKEIELRSLFGGSRIGDAIPLDAPAGAQSAEASVDTSGASGVAFVLRPKPQGDDQLIIADDELARMAPLGALELVLKAFPGATPADGRAFTATFEA